MSTPARSPARRHDTATRSIRWSIGAVLFIGLAILAVLLMPRADEEPASLLAFGITTLLLGGLGALLLAMIRRAEDERAVVDAERRLARVSVEEQMTARRRAEQADAVSRELVQLLGRELRGPLASIRGFARQLTDHTTDLWPEQREEFFAIIRAQSHRLIRVIEDLMLAARLAAGDSGSDSQVPVDMAALVRDTVDEVDAPAEHRVVVTSSPELPRVRGDAGELRQAVLALVENAVRFSPSGGVIEVSALPSAEGGVEVSVRDEGLGVPAELRDTMFDLLSRGENDQGDELEPGGLGVGLFIARGVAARCGGEVKYESAPERGSVFTLLLPGIMEGDEVLLTPVGDPGRIERP